MKRLFVAMAALCLCACAAVPTPPPPPVAIADQTTLDEQIGLGATTAYRGAVAVARLANRVKPFSPSTRTKAAELDAKAFAAIAAMRAAYEAGNATDYRTAAGKARDLAEQIISLVGGVS